MAYTSSSRRPSTYRGGPPPKRSGNTAAVVIAGVVVVGLVVLVVAASGGSKPTPPPETPVIRATPPPTPPPTSPAAEKPWPVIPAETFEQAKTLASSFADDARRADALYSESLKAKQAGDDALWQKKLGEAKQLYEGIKNRWNDFVDALPSNRDHDAEEVLRKFFLRESGQVQAYIKKLGNMKSDERIK